MIRVDRAVFVVTESTKKREPLYIAFRFQEAKAFQLRYNRLTQSGKSVLRSGRAVIEYSEAKECSPSASTS